MPDIVTGKIFVDGEKGITSTKMNQIISQAVIQPDFVTTKPSSSTLDPTDQLLEVKGTGAYAKITGQQLSDSVAGSSSITAMRLRSFNAIGNPNFEVDQRTVGAGTQINNAFAQDRWPRGGALGFGAAQTSFGASPPILAVPGTNFAITSKFLRVTLITQKASLAATDLAYIYQSIEGASLRELINDVHSAQIFCRSTVASQSFGLSFRDSAAAYSLVSLCTLGAANTWTLIQVPNLPIWTASGTFPITPGSTGYTLGICLAAGSTFVTPANGSWQSGNLLGAVGQSNWAANPVNSYFDIAFVQHEPGALCTTPMDKPFTQNLDECLRYYTKSYPYATAIGTVNANSGVVCLYNGAGISPTGHIPFKKTMAKTPTVTGYSNITGAVNTVRDATAAGDRAITGANFIGDSCFGGFTATTPNPAVWVSQFHYTADTGW